MDKKYLIVLSTNKDLNENDTALALLQKTEVKEACGAEFGSSFYPIINVDSDGIIRIICEDDDLSDDAVLIIIPDSQELETVFLNNIQNRLSYLDALYVLLHYGANSIHDTHQKEVLNKAHSCLQKISLAKCHHTQSTSRNPKHALGDGLEMIAKAILTNPVNTIAFKAGLDYLKTKPDYYNPLKESLIHLYKSLKIIPLKLKDNWTEDSFKKEKKTLANSDSVELVKDELGSISFESNITKFYNQFEAIETKIIQLSTTDETLVHI